mgnify:FL=1
MTATSCSTCRPSPKTWAAATQKALFQDKGDILISQLSFTQDSASLKPYQDKQDFVGTYPFAPYHFQLVQKIFESIRKAGATGLHLSRGERSMLDAFQSAAKKISDREVSALVPLHAFYPAIESFLDTAVKRTIDQTRVNPGLEKDFDVRLLQILFLIRYVDIIQPNVDNLVTLFIDQVDADRLAIKDSYEFITSFNQHKDDLLETSIPNMSYLLEEFGTAEAYAYDQIEQKQQQTGDADPDPQRRKTKVIRVSTITPKPYLESEQDVEACLETLRQKLLQELTHNIRIRLQ